jgi:threonine/homoserine/homoserine lactone efflux protein
MALFLSKTLAQGRRAGFAALAGAFSGLLFHTLLAAFGLSALLLQSASLFGALKFAGALYLLWLAIDAVRHGGTPKLEGDDRSASLQPAAEVYLTGLGANLLNPKIILFFVTFLPQFVSSDDPHAVSKLLFLGLYFITVAFPICAAIILGAEAIAGWLKRSPYLTRGLDWLFAGVFASFALRLLFERARG